MHHQRPTLRISFNAPAVLTFAALCALAQVLNLVTFGTANRLVFSVYRSSLTDPLTYVRFFGHVLGHSGWNHLIGNVMYLLILGPMLEDRYGTKAMISVLLMTAFVTGLVNFIFFPRIALMGASGIVFAMILLSSITTADGHSIPFSFLLVAVLYIGQQLYEGVFISDNISQVAHIVGGAVGTVMGFSMNRRG